MLAEPAADLKRAKTILCLDGGGGLLVGLGLLGLHDFFAELFRFPVELVKLIGAANLLYGLYSGTLAARALAGRFPGRRTVAALIVANALWAVACLALLIFLGTLEFRLGALHVAAECLFVGWLATAEGRHVLPLAK